MLYIASNKLPELDQSEENGNVFVPKAEWGASFKMPPNMGNPNGLTKKQEIMVRSAIKYWVERHKHVVRYVCYNTIITDVMLSLILLLCINYQHPPFHPQRQIRYPFY